MKTHLAWLSLLIAVGAFLWSGDAAAQDRIIVPGFERGKQHNGFMLRLAAGFGMGSAAATHDGGGPDVEVSGISPPGSVFNLAVGGAIGENLLLHGSVGAGILVGPNTTIGGSEVNTRFAEDTSLSMIYFGPGVTYYIMPINVYVSGTIGLGTLRWSSDSDDDLTLPYESLDDSTNQATGAVLSAMIGKEWWISSNWGIGVAAHVMTGSATYSDPGEADFDLTDASWRFTHYGLLFSATYN